MKFAPRYASPWDAISVECPPVRINIRSPVDCFIPAASRALIIPVIIVALIYKIGHFEDWSKFDVFLLLAFQVAISFLAASLLGGHFQTAVIILVVFAGILAVIAGFMRNL